MNSRLKTTATRIALGNAGRHTVNYTNLAVMLTVSCADISLERFTSAAMLVTWLRHYIMCSTQGCLSFIGACYQPNNTRFYFLPTCPWLYGMEISDNSVSLAMGLFTLPLNCVHATLSNHVNPCFLRFMLLVDFIALYLIFWKRSFLSSTFLLQQHFEFFFFTHYPQK